MAFTYTYREDPTTLADFLTNLNSIAIGYKTVEFLALSSDVKILLANRNIDSLWRSLDADQQEDWYQKYTEFSESSKDDDYDAFPLNPDTIIIVEETESNKLILITKSTNQTVINTSTVPFFIDNTLRALMDNEKYVRREKQATQFSPRCTVWWWSRTMHSVDGGLYLINISPFIENLNTQSAQQGGTWSISISPQGTGFIRNAGRWEMDSTKFTYAGEKLNYVSQASYNREDDKRRHFHWNTLMQQNDMIFIQFEPLELDTDKNIKEDYIIPRHELPDRVYDMIGVVRDVNYSMATESAGVTIKASGGDLSSVLQQDNFVFYPEQFLFGELVYTRTGSQGTDIKGIERTTNALVGFTVNYKTLDILFPFVINALSTINFVPGSLFSGYGDRRTNHYGLVEGKLRLAEGTYQITKLSIDKNIKKRYIVASNLGMGTGTIQSFLQQMVREPFVEMLTDTYLDQFYITLRQSPWDKAYKKLAEFCEEKYTIENKDVLAENLMMNTQDIYSWYRLIPKAATMGAADKTVWTYFKAVRFAEYAQLYGEKILEINSNYLNFFADKEKDDVENSEKVLKQAILDLKLMVDCYSYMPFTRRGSIMIRGDRRYKKGMILYFKPTDEYFYIDGVSHTFVSNESTNDRTTTLNVSRGMVKKYLDKYLCLDDKDTKTGVIDTRINEIEGEVVGSAEWIEKVILSWNFTDNLLFFLRRKQFAEREIEAFGGGDEALTRFLNPGLNQEITGSLTSEQDEALHGFRIDEAIRQGL